VLKLAAFATVAGYAHVPLAASAPPSDRKTAVRSRPLMTLRLTTAPTQTIGAGPRGTRVTFPITGGSFEGARLRGVVLPGGDDWTVKRPDGVMELDLRITLKTDDGALIHMTFEGIRDEGTPGRPYFRTLPRFEAAETTYAFLNRLLALGTGQLGADGPVHAIEELI
jgi:Protein of unknown function (DUF3237)